MMLLESENLGVLDANSFVIIKQYFRSDYDTIHIIYDYNYIMFVDGYGKVKFRLSKEEMCHLNACAGDYFKTYQSDALKLLYAFKINEVSLLQVTPSEYGIYLRKGAEDSSIFKAHFSCGQNFFSL
jgi:hypothetical protein